MSSRCVFSFVPNQRLFAMLIQDPWLYPSDSDIGVDMKFIHTALFNTNEDGSLKMQQMIIF